MHSLRGITLLALDLIQPIIGPKLGQLLGEDALLTDSSGKRSRSCDRVGTVRNGNIFRSLSMFDTSSRSTCFGRLTDAGCGWRWGGQVGHRVESCRTYQGLVLLEMFSPTGRR